jgi:hypothetical protein
MQARSLKYSYDFWLENLKEINYQGDLEVDETIKVTWVKIKQYTLSTLARDKGQCYWLRSISFRRTVPWNRLYI